MTFALKNTELNENLQKIARICKIWRNFENWCEGLQNSSGSAAESCTSWKTLQNAPIRPRWGKKTAAFVSPKTSFGSKSCQQKKKASSRKWRKFTHQRKSAAHLGMGTRHMWSYSSFPSLHARPRRYLVRTLDVVLFKFALLTSLTEHLRRRPAAESGESSPIGESLQHT